MNYPVVLFVIRSMIENSFAVAFNEKFKYRFELGTLYVASLGFLIHLGIILAKDFGFLTFSSAFNGLLGNPIAAIYTPFSFILVYEVYLLIYYLPQSFSISIAKQLEIVSLILIRRIFKDISKLDITHMDELSSANLNLVYDIIGFLLLFFLIFLFRALIVNRTKHTVTEQIKGFILYKKVMCLILLPLFLFLSAYSFTSWVIEINQFSVGLITELRDFNKIFYNEFFTALVIVDVFILIASFHYTDRYSLLIRNTGFVITTVLIRISFSASGLTNVILLISGAAFGVLILYLYSLYDRIDKGETTKESYAYL